MNVSCSCRLTPRLQERGPWLPPTRSWWTWAPPPRTHLLPGQGGDGGDGDDVQSPGRPRHPAAPFSPAATEGSWWPRLHLVRKERETKLYFLIFSGPLQVCVDAELASGFPDFEKVSGLLPKLESQHTLASSCIQFFIAVEYKLEFERWSYLTYEESGHHPSL